ncbi:hypothetical protein AB6A40_001070 [Gnathostoma spinigerum]|uniref:Uncharacterized protein n=1 Tax=Gnathostoma spinigerum TaxID=75299 RepID=A0ABD6E4L3_9BILA
MRTVPYIVDDNCLYFRLVLIVREIAKVIRRAVGMRVRPEIIKVTLHFQRRRLPNTNKLDYKTP